MKSPDLATRLHHLESLDRISRMAVGSQSLPDLLQRLIAEVRTLFQVDRAWLIHPCSPDAESWKLMIHDHGPEFGGYEFLDMPIPMDDGTRRLAQEALEACGPVSYGPDFPHPWASAGKHKVLSQLHILVDPEVGEPWLLGIHQCSHPRVWTEAERQLLSDISARVAPILRLLLTQQDPECRRANHELVATESRRRAVLGAIPDLIFLNAADGTYLDYHTPDPNLLLFPPDTFLGRRIEDFLAPDLAHTFRSHMEAALATGERQVFEYHLEIPAGRRSFEARICRCEDHTTVTLIRDITERHTQARLEAEVHRTQKLESLGVLAGGIAHDFNNILAGLLGYLSLMQETPGLPEDFQEMLQRSHKATSQAKDLTRQLLTFAKGGAPLKELCSLGELLEESVRFCLRGTPCCADLALAPDLQPVWVDRSQMGQVFQNLILNALQAMPGGGVLRVEARNLDRDHVPAPGMAPGPCLEVVLRDSGCGIPSAQLGRIFDPFYTTKSAGSGLGLAIVHSILQHHGAHIAVESQEGIGTTFRLMIPAARMEEPLSQPQPEASAPPVSTFRGEGPVLVLDDEPEVRIMAATLLRRYGFTVDTAGHGQEAIRLWEAARQAGHPYRLGLFDVTIPGGMGGPEAARLILAQDPGARLVMSSGYAASGDTPDFCARLPKPYTFSELGRLLETVLGS